MTRDCRKLLIQLSSIYMADKLIKYVVQYLKTTIFFLTIFFTNDEIIPT